MSSNSYLLPDSLRGLGDDEWLDRISSQGAVPGLPEETTAAALTGIPMQVALREASVFYRTVKAYCDALAMPLGPHRRVLDFGAGWGCFSRFFVRDVDAAGIHGCDFDRALIELGRASEAVAGLDQLYPDGKLPYADNTFDCIIAYSAFAQLPPAAHLHWVRELARVASPGCVFTFTVESRRLLDPPPAAAPGDTGASVPGAAELLKAYDRGDIAYVPPDPEAGEGALGRTAVPIDFIRRQWKPPFEVRDSIDEAHRFSRAVVIVQHA